MPGNDTAKTEMPCSTGAADCSLADQLNYDGRSFKLEVKNAPNDLPLAVLPAVVFNPATRPAEYVDWHRTRSPPPGPSVPLNVFYCVYLK